MLVESCLYKFLSQKYSYVNFNICNFYANHRGALGDNGATTRYLKPSSLLTIFQSFSKPFETFFKI